MQHKFWNCTFPAQDEVLGKEKKNEQEVGKTVAQLRRKYKSINFPARTNRKDGGILHFSRVSRAAIWKRQNIKRKMWRKFNEYKLAREGGK